MSSELDSHVESLPGRWDNEDLRSEASSMMAVAGESDFVCDIDDESRDGRSSRSSRSSRQTEESVDSEQSRLLNDEEDFVYDSGEFEAGFSAMKMKQRRHAAAADAMTESEQDLLYAEAEQGKVLGGALRLDDVAGVSRFFEGQPFMKKLTETLRETVAAAGTSVSGTGAIENGRRHLQSGQQVREPSQNAARGSNGRRDQEAAMESPEAENAGGSRNKTITDEIQLPAMQCTYDKNN